MSAQNTPLSFQQHSMRYSNILTNTEYPSTFQHTPFHTNIYNHHSKEHSPHFFSRSASNKMKNPIAQSVILPSQNVPPTDQLTISTLSNMAKQVQEENKKPAKAFKRVEFIMPSTNHCVSNNNTPKNTQFPKSMPFQTAQQQSNKEVKRRESVNLSTMDSKRFQDLSFLQRKSQLLFKFQIQTKSTEKPFNKSCIQPTKPKNLEFLKKKKVEIDCGTPTGREGAHRRLSQNCFPKRRDLNSFAATAAEFKSKFYSKNSEQEQGSAQMQMPTSKPETKNTQSTIEFKKRRFADSPIQRKKQDEQPNFKSKFNDCRHVSNQKPKKQFTLANFELLDKLGKGAFGEVFMAQQKELGLLCVLKKMSKKKIREMKVQEHVIRQIKLQSYLCHGNLTSIYGYFADEDYIYLILELLPDGSLQQVKKKKKLPEKDTVNIVVQVAKGLKYLHEQRIIHRDLKPQNLFVNESHIKIGDFGCSIYHNTTSLRSTVVGCLEYSSPEQLSKDGYTNKIDSWSLGILTYELLFGKSPFEQHIRKIVSSSQENVPPLSEVVFPAEPQISQEAQEFILNLLSNDPESRMEMDEVLDHPFLGDTDKIRMRF